MKIRTLLALLVLGLGLALSACSQQAPVPLTEEEILAKAETIHEQALTMDTHVDIGRQYATAELDPGSEDNDLRCSLPKMEKGGLDGVFLAVYVGQRGGLDEEGYKSAYDAAMTKFEAIHRLAETMHPDRCELATSADDVERIAKTGKRVIMIGIENGYPVGEDLALLQKYYDLGARYITLSHSGHNQICDSSSPSEPMHNGLSDFGKQVVAEMNRLGIVIDVSHISKKSYWDVIEGTKAPIMASHSGCAALNDHNRNLDDDQLRALAKNGGVIQVVALGGFLKGQSAERMEAISKLREELGYRRVRRQQLQSMTEEEQSEYQKLVATYRERMQAIDAQYPHSVTVKDYVDHIDHAVKIAGIDHVGVGTDFDGGGGISGFNDHSECLNVTTELLRRGYSEEEIKKIWGGNLMRVWREVERVAAERADLD